MKRVHILLALMGLAFVLARPSLAQEATPIRFAGGATSAQVAGTVVRGERALHTLQARAGQTLTARISATENNAVFQIFAPGARAEWRDGVLHVTGSALPGAGEGQDQRVWRGRLTVGGAYLFVVGGTRGNAHYRLNVTLR